MNPRVDNLCFRRRTADVVSAGVETSNEETSNTITTSTLGEGEGRSNRISDEEFRELVTNLKPDENTEEKGINITTVIIVTVNVSSL